MKLRLASMLALAALLPGQVLAQSVYSTPYSITTLAGDAPGSTDGSGVAARFNQPNGLALDQAGDIFVADRQNNTIREITPAGIVTTIAGTVGVPGSADGTRGDAQFNNPTSVAVDGPGNVYVADTGNCTIRKITPQGVVSTLAGVAGQNSAETSYTGKAVLFANPTGVAVDVLGNVFVADYGSSTIRKITPSGVVTTLAGLAFAEGPTDGTGSAARFELPCGLALDSNGNIFVLDLGNSIRKVTPSGVVTTVTVLPAGTLFSGQPGLLPFGLGVDAADNCYLPAPYNDTILKVTPAGVISTIAGVAGSAGSTDGAGSVTQFSYPTAVAVNGAGAVYVADCGNDAIRCVSASGSVVTIAGSAPVGYLDGTGSLARFYFPNGVAVDPTGNLYVTDWGNYTIRKITPAGVVTTLAGRAGIQGSADGVGSDARFSYPSAIAVDSTGNLFVSDYDAIRKITPTGTVSTLAGVVGVPGDADGTGASARFNSPWRLTINGAGNLYVCDYSNGIIRKVTQSGVVTTLPIAPDTIGSPEGIAFDGFGNLYIADNSNSVIFKYGVSGTLSVLAGLGDVTGNADGTGAAARFNRPTDLASDGSGNIYVVDANDSTVRRITPTGVVTTLAGAAGIPGSADGVGYGARFNFFGASPGIAVDNSGVIYLADEPNNTIRKGIPSATPTPTAWLTNFAGRAFVDSTIARGNLTAGFVTTGSFPKQVLVRAIGPGLQPFGVTGVLANPSFTVYQGSTAGQTVTGWNSSLVGLFQSLGAFPLASGSNDAATQATFNPGAYTAIVSSADGTQSGNAMVELYDADSAAPTVRLVNASALAFVGAGGRILIGGFVMDGSGSETVLIRGVGPTLGALGVTGSLAQPWLQVFDREGTVIASIKGWGGAPTAGASSISAGLQPASTAIMNAVGAFSLPNGSADSAMVLTLPVGAYTAFVQSANGGSGVALLEIYEVR